MNQAQKITLIGALVLIIAAFLPWIKPTVLFGEAAISQESIAVGWEGDGIITGGVGWILLLVAFFFKGKPGKMYSLQIATAGLLACCVIFSDFRRIAEVGPTTGILAATDIGLYLTLAGGLVIIAGGLQKISPGTIKKNHGSGMD